MVNEQVAGRVLARIDGIRDEVIELSRSLIRFDSVNRPPWGNEGPCQAFITHRMEEMGLEVDVFRPDEVSGIEDDPAYLHGRDYTDRPNVVGVLRGGGNGPSLHLSAHVDVMPIEQPDRWIVDPFAAAVIDGRIVGRGACDDKDGLTAILMAVEAVRRSGLQLRGDVILSSYVDEEYAGGNGLLSIVRKGYRGDAAVNCDGLGYSLWVANTGGGPFRVMIQSRIDAPLPTDAMRRVQQACLRKLAELSRELRSGWDHPLYPPGTPNILKSEPIELRPWEEGLEPWLWLRYGPVVGVAGYATTLPGQGSAGIKASIEKAVAEAYESCNCRQVYPPRVEWTYRFMDACQVPASEPVVKTLGGAVERVTGRAGPVTGGVRCDLYMLALHGGIPAVSFGVGGRNFGKEGGAHQPNECILIDDELMPYVKIIALTLLDWCGYIS